ncbi:hypothetical protein JCM17846_25120 [Iodidimonas nitroreducens]|uniref:Methanolan biosynthesis EpsI domain-containing protein n=2 Tax=Iodidimonas nitroreducens TaxID=1236968 RepID=A0A5A7NBG2_9PROT|nr:hypothetical protein JCM17846_25120 [Iodidimonas nitroreducens]
MARALIFPLGYLFFMVPFGDFAIAPLQDLTAHYTAILVRWTGIPIYHENWTLVIPGGTFLVAEACAGVRFLIACVALGALIAGTFLKRWWKRVVFLTLAIAVPIIANVVRAYGIVLVAHYSNFEHAVGVDHLIYGFVFLSFVMLILILAAWWMRDVGPDALFAAPRADSDTADLKSSALSRPDLMPIGAAATLALLMALGVRFYSHHALQIAPAPLVQLYAPEGFAGPGGWTFLGKAEAGDWVGDFSAADAQETWVYAKGDTRFSVFMAFYGDQGPEKEIISYRNDLIGPQALDVVQVGVTKPDFMGPDLPPANLMRLSGPDGQRLVWYWYILPSDATANRSSVKLKGLWAKFRGARAPAMVLAISAPGLQLADEQGRLQDFLRSTGFDETLQKGGFAPWVARHEMITGKNADVRNSRHIR